MIKNIAAQYPYDYMNDFYFTQTSKEEWLQRHIHLMRYGCYKVFPELLSEYKEDVEKFLAPFGGEAFVLVVHSSGFVDNFSLIVESPSHWSVCPPYDMRDLRGDEQFVQEKIVEWFSKSSNI